MDREKKNNVHGDIVGDDGLLLELELLEDSRLEDLLGDCSEISLAREFSALRDNGENVRILKYLMTPKTRAARAA